MADAAQAHQHRVNAYFGAQSSSTAMSTSAPWRLAQLAETLSRPGLAGRLGRLLDRWIDSACLRFGLDGAKQEHSGFRHSCSVYQLECSRNLRSTSGRVMERVSDTVVDRTRTRLDVPTRLTLFGVRARKCTRRGRS